MRTLLFSLSLSVLLALGASGCGDDDGGGDNNNQNNGNSVVNCGDNVAAGAETCDGMDLRLNDCTTIGLGYTGGTLACNATCTGWDVALCMTGTCGDAQLDTGELCDTTNLDGNDCTTINQGFIGGTLACAASCQAWDTTLCTDPALCGNGNIDTGEDCDGTNHGSADCTTLGFGYTGGTLACNTDCTWNHTGCTSDYCGNYVIEGSELCDSDEVGTATCANIGQGYTGGTLECRADCSAYDVSQCTGGTATCGNAAVEGGEVCDGADLNGHDCSTLGLGYTGGTLSCDASSGCLFFDTSQCTINAVCGNGVRDAFEQCDGNDLLGLTCLDFGFTGGTMTCDAGCRMDFSGCTGSVAGWTCIPDYYGDGDCDCGCGIIDSDCADALASSCDWCDSPGGCNGTGFSCPGIIDPNDNSQCVSTSCGNNIQEGTEQCDGSDLQGAGCTDLGLGFTGGTLGCQTSCVFDFNQCTVPVCGDGAVEGTELCDDTNLNQNDCETIGLGFGGGTLACSASCHGWDTSQCTMPVCGNGTQEATELCDGADLDQNDCTTIGLGFGSGTLACNGTCDGWDTSLCSNAVCGNDTAEGGEACDGTDLGGNDCTTLGLPFTGGTLSCDVNSNCLGFNTSQCVVDPVCGNNVQEGFEQCDGNDVQGVVCADFGYTGGSVGCSGACLFDLSGCTSGIAGWTCNPSYYAGSDGCDCGCGIPDPDCGGNASATACDYCTNWGSCGGYDSCPGIINPTNNAQCTATSCGDGAAEGTEQCDNTDLRGQTCVSLGAGFMAGNLSCDGSCRFVLSACTVPVCGNGQVESPEECDDGNNVDGDGCSMNCRFEWTVVTETEPNNNAATANGPFGSQTAVVAAVGTSGDFDWYAITVPAGATLAVQVGDGGTGLCASGSLDSEVAIFDTNGTTQLAFNDDISLSNYCSVASAGPVAGGTYYVYVASSQAYAPTDTFNYVLYVLLQ